MNNFSLRQMSRFLQIERQTNGVLCNLHAYVFVNASKASKCTYLMIIIYMLSVTLLIWVIFRVRYPTPEREDTYLSVLQQ